MANEPSKHYSIMHSALDQEASEQELEALSVQLETDAEMAGHWRRLRQVDRLLHETPAVGPLPGFAGRVMAAISAMNLTQWADQRIGLGIMVGLALVALLAVPLLSGLLILLVSLITNPGTFNAVLDAVANAAGYVVGLIASLADALNNTAGDVPMLPALVSIVILLSILWVWLVRRLSRGSRSSIGR